MTVTEPIDSTHAESIAATAAIRRAIMRLRADVARWELPRYEARRER